MESNRDDAGVSRKSTNSKSSNDKPGKEKLSSSKMLTLFKESFGGLLLEQSNAENPIIHCAVVSRSLPPLSVDELKSLISTAKIWYVLVNDQIYYISVTQNEITKIDVDEYALTMFKEITNAREKPVELTEMQIKLIRFFIKHKLAFGELYDENEIESDCSVFKYNNIIKRGLIKQGKWSCTIQPDGYISLSCLPRCGMIDLSDLPSLDDLVAHEKSLQGEQLSLFDKVKNTIKSDRAYIIQDQTVFYFDKIEKTCSKVILNEKGLEFLLSLKTNGENELADSTLDEITHITGHMAHKHFLMGIKLHVSFDDEDEKNVEKGWDAIVSTIYNYKRVSSKVVNISRAKDDPDKPEQCGKQVTIYTSIHPDDTNWEDFLNKITYKLEEANVKPGYKEAGGIAINCYLSYRFDFDPKTGKTWRPDKDEEAFPPGVRDTLNKGNVYKPNMPSKPFPSAVSPGKGPTSSGTL